jgi:hypothetical protein
MSTPKLRGYLYEIVEVFPAPECDLGVRVLTVHDRLEDAEKVIAVLESVNYNFTCYGMMMRPVWEDTPPKKQTVGWDANGSPVIDGPGHSPVPLHGSWSAK